MFPVSSFTSVAQHVLDLTSGFTPLFLGLLGILGCSLLGLAFSIRKEAQQETARTLLMREELPAFPKAA